MSENVVTLQGNTWSAQQRAEVLVMDWHKSSQTMADPVDLQDLENRIAAALNSQSEERAIFCRETSRLMERIRVLEAQLAAHS